MMAIAHAAFAADPSPPWPCTLASRGPALVQLRGADLPIPASVDDCRAARVVRGQVIACQADARGQPVCRTFKTGDVISAKALGTSGLGSLISSLDHLLRGNPGAQIGQSRGLEAMLPEQTVLLLDQKVWIDFGDKGLRGVESVEIRRDNLDGPMVLRADRSDHAEGLVRLHAKDLAPGQDYWAVMTPSPLPTQTPRQFRMATARQVDEVRAHWRAFDRQRAGPLATAMMRAAWLAENQYEYDALVTLKAIGVLAP